MNLSQGILGRRLRPRHVVVFSFTLVNFMLSCQACDCTYHPEVCDGHYIFEGTITAKYGNVSAYEDITYSVDVLDVTRDAGNSLTPGAVVNISTGSHTCGYPDLEVNWTVFFSTGSRDDLYTSSYNAIDRCGSVVWTADGDAYYLPPDTDLSCSAPPTALGTATPLLLLLCSTVAMWFYSLSCN